jgi:hypothetical protein
MIGVGLCALILSSVLLFAQDGPEDLEHRPVDIALLMAFMDRSGHTNYERLEVENKKVLRFKAKDREHNDVVEFVIMYLPDNQTLKFECPALAEVPPTPEKRNRLNQRLMELNGWRTIGKYCLGRDNTTVRYFHYRTVAGGICYADFVKTLRMIEYMVFSDLETIRDY